jgi:autotransporter-associated beta strand protein
MILHHNGRAHALLAPSFLALILGASNAFAASLVWTGASSNSWNNGANWTPSSAPVNRDSVAYDATSVNPNSNNNIAGLTLSGLAFNAGSPAIAVTGNPINMGVIATGTGITSAGDIVSASANGQTISLPVTLNSGKHLITTGAAVLNLNGGVTQSKGSTAIFTDGGGGINVAGSGLANVNGILGGWATLGANWASVGGGNTIVPYAAYTDVAGGGTIADGVATNVRIPTAGGAVTMAAAGTTTINSLLFSGGAAAQTVTVGAGNTLVLGQNGGIYNASGLSTLRALTIGTAGVGNITAGDGVNPANITLTGPPVGGTATVMTANSNINNNANAPVSLTLMGGYFTLGGTTSNFSGGIYVVSGRLSGPTQVAVANNEIFISPGGQANVGVPLTNNFSLAGNGTAENAGMGALRLFGTARLPGTITLTADASVGANNVVGDAIGFSGKITGPGGLIVGAPTATATGAGVISIGATTGAGIASDYVGDTTISGAAGGTVASTLKIATTTGSNNNVLPHGSTGSFAGGSTGNMILNATAANRQAILDLNGSTQTINGLSSTITTPASNFVQSAAGNGLLILGDSNATANFGGIVQNGAGTMSIRKIGSDKQTFSNGNTYGGTTEVNAGTLQVDGKHTGAGAYTVASAATLAGSGVITFGATGSLTVSSGGVVAPGSSVGTLGLDGSVTGSPLVTFAPGALLTYELGAGLTSDRIAIVSAAASDIVFGGNTINFVDLAAGALADGAYTLFTADVSGAYSGLATDGGGFITSGLSIGTGLGAYGIKNLQVVGNDIVLNVKAVPEPATAALAALGITGLMMARRRRAIEVR